jgi:hypothetical protein
MREEQKGTDPGHGLYEGHIYHCHSMSFRPNHAG